MTKNSRSKNRKVVHPKSEKDRAVESYAARLRSMGPDKVLLARIEKFEKDYRAAH
jgi:hypothetical protein